MNRLLIKLLAVCFSGGMAFGYGMREAFTELPIHSSNGEPVTLVEYERLKIGMTIAETQSLLGRGTEVNQSQTKATIVWSNPNGSTITATFEKNKLINKEQSKLKSP
jgi:hypothetical protein